MNSSDNESKKNQSNWNEHSNLNKFQAKKETRRASTNAFRQFLRRPSSQTIVDTVNKVADKAANMVDQSLNENGLDSIGLFGLESSSIVEFTNCMSRLLASPSISSTTSAKFTNANSSGWSSLLKEFEALFKANFGQLYQELAKQMKQFVDKFVEALKRNEQLISNSNKQNEVVQEFFKKVYKIILTSGSIKAYLDKCSQIKSNQESSQSDQQQQQQQGDDGERLNEAIMIWIESYVTNNIYDYVFPTIMSEFEEQDMHLQKRIRDFYWITNDMIGTCIDENSIFYRDSYEEALNCKKNWIIQYLSN